MSRPILPPSTPRRTMAGASWLVAHTVSRPQSSMKALPTISSQMVTHWFATHCNPSRDRASYYDHGSAGAVAGRICVSWALGFQVALRLLDGVNQGSAAHGPWPDWHLVPEALRGACGEGEVLVEEAVLGTEGSDDRRAPDRLHEVAVHGGLGHLQQRDGRHGEAEQ